MESCFVVVVWLIHLSGKVCSVIVEWLLLRIVRKLENAGVVFLLAWPFGVVATNGA